MEALNLRFNHIDINKISVCFTWDDNCHAHCRLTAPLFSDMGLRCTFYINPGNEGYGKKYLAGYQAISGMGFEIGSHGYYHNNLSEIRIDELKAQIKMSSDSIYEDFGIYPSTFAFPYHEFNEHTLDAVRRFHLETRNTLHNSVRLSVRTSVTADAMRTAIDESVSERRNIVFSGHSAVLNEEDASLPESGYEPVVLENLRAVLKYAQTLKDSAEVLTFEQAALKEYIKENCEITGDSYLINEEQLKFLSAFKIDAERLSVLI